MVAILLRTSFLLTYLVCSYGLLQSTCRTGIGCTSVLSRIENRISSRACNLKLGTGLAANFPAIATARGKSANQALSSIAFFAGLLNPVIAGGLLSGGLHAVTGPDHLAALLPPSVGQPGWYGMKLGAIWGLGHGFSAMFLGLIAFAMKGSIHVFPDRLKFILKLGHLTEAAVGVSLLAIGAVGIKENLDEMKNSEQSESVNEPVAASKTRSSRALFANGLVHGFSWDGAPSLAPALAMTSWRSAVYFLLSYCVGTMAAMSVTAGAFGEGSMRLGKFANNPQLPRNLSIGSSVVAILIGIYWIFQALVLK